MTGPYQDPRRRRRPRTPWDEELDYREEDELYGDPRVPPSITSRAAAAPTDATRRVPELPDVRSRLRRPPIDEFYQNEFPAAPAPVRVPQAQPAASTAVALRRPPVAGAPAPSPELRPQVVPSSIAPATRQLAVRQQSFRQASPIARMARAAESGLGQMVAGFGGRELGRQISTYAVPDREELKPHEQLTELGATLLAGGAAAGAAVRGAAGVLGRAGMKLTSPAGRLFFPPAGASYGRKALANYLGAGTGPLLDVAYAADEPGGLEEKVRAFGTATAFSAGGAAFFSGLQHAWQRTRPQRTAGDPVIPDEGGTPPAGLGEGGFLGYVDPSGERNPRFTSRLRSHLEKMEFGRTKAKPAKQWMAQFEKGGPFPKEEYELVLKRALAEAAEEGRELTQADVLALGEARPIEIRETLRGGPRAPVGEQLTPVESERAMAAAARYRDFFADELGNPDFTVHAALEAIHGFDDRTFRRYVGQAGLDAAEVTALERYRRVRSGNREPLKPTKYSSYTEPGGEDYREVLLQLDPNAGHRRRLEELKAKNTTTPAEDTEMQALYALLRDEPRFTHGHWEEDNLIAHMRLKTRKGPNGEKILAAEEFQSDWAQQGRDKGFADPDHQVRLREEADRIRERERPLREEVARLRVEEQADPAYIEWQRQIDEAREAFYAVDRNRLHNPQERSRLRDRFYELEDTVPEALRERRGRRDAAEADLDAGMDRLRQLEQEAEAPGIPVLPLYRETKDWTGLVMKRLIDEAVQGGYQRVIWTPGEVQNRRWSLASVADRLVYDRGTKVLTAYKNGEYVTSHEVGPEGLPGVVGRDVSAALLAAPANGTYHELKLGEGTEIGGGGMRTFYGTKKDPTKGIVPEWVASYAKKRGVRIDVGAAGPGTRGPPPQPPADIEIDPAKRATLEREEYKKVKKLFERISEGGARFQNLPIGEMIPAQTVYERRALDFRGQPRRGSRIRRWIDPNPEVVAELQRNYGDSPWWSLKVVTKKPKKKFDVAKAAKGQVARLVRERGPEALYRHTDQWGVTLTDADRELVEGYSRVFREGRLRDPVTARSEYEAAKGRYERAVDLGEWPGFDVTPEMRERFQSQELGTVGTRPAAAAPSPFGGGIVQPHEASSTGRVGWLRGFVDETTDQASVLRDRVTRALTRPDGEDAVFAAAAETTGRPLVGVRRIQGGGVWGDHVSPTTVDVFRLDTDWETARIKLAMEGLLHGQDAQLMFERAPRNYKGARPGIVFTGPDGARLTETQLAAMGKLLSSDPRFSGLGATEAEGHLLFLHTPEWSDLAPGEFRAKIHELARELPGTVDAHDAHYRAEVMDGPTSYLRALGRDPDAVRRVRGLLDQSEAAYREHAGAEHGTDALRAVTERFARVRRGLEELERSYRLGPAPRAKPGRPQLEVARELAEAARGDERPLHWPTKGKKFIEQGKAVLDRLTTHFTEALESGYEERLRKQIAGDWYDGSIEAAHRQIDVALPELADSHPGLRSLFNATWAILSNGQAVEPNTRAALGIFDQFLRAWRGLKPDLSNLRELRLTGKQPDTYRARIEEGRRGQAVFRTYGKPGRGPAGERIKGHARGNQHELQLAKLTDWLHAALRESGGNKDEALERIQRMLTGEVTFKKASPKPFTVHEFGQKIGQFFRDVQGVPSDNATVDLWIMRLANQALGITPTVRGKLDDSASPVQNRLVQQAIRQATVEFQQRTGVELSTKAVQADLWYAIKNQFSEAGAGYKKGAFDSYADAVARFFSEGQGAKKGLLGGPEWSGVRMMAGGAGGQVAGGLLGGAVGGLFGDTEEERATNRERGALIGATLGTAAGMVAAQGRRRGPKYGLKPLGTRGTIGQQPGQQPTQTPEELRTAKAAEYIRMGRFPELSPELKGVVEQQMIDVAKATGRDPKDVESWAQVVAAGRKKIKTDPTQLLQLDPKKVSSAESYALATMAQTRATQMDELATRIRNEPDLERQAELTAEMARYNDEQVKLLDILSRSRSEHGRALNAEKILAGLTNTPAMWQFRAAKHAGRELTQVERDTITRYLDAGERAQAMRFITSLRKKSGKETFLDLWTVGLLTNPKTHVVNVTGNTTFAAFEQLARTPAAVADWFMGKATGIRTKTPGFSLGMRDFGRAVADAREVLKGLPVGQDLILGNFDTRGGTTGSAIADAYINTVGRLLRAEDALGNRLARRSSLEEQAAVSALMAGKKGKDRRAHITQFLASPPDEAMLRAGEDALVRTFQDKTWFGKKARQAQKTFGRFFVPFTKTPGAIMQRTIESSPIGLLLGGVEGKRAVDAIRAAVKAGKPVTPELKKMQRVAAEKMGRGALGTGLMAAGWYLYHNAMASGDVSSELNERRKDLAQLVNIPTDAIRLGQSGYWIQPNQLGIPALALLWGAAIGQAAENNDADDVLTRTGLVLGTYVRLLTDMPFFRGAQDIVNVTKDPGAYMGRVARSAVGSVVPAAVGALARATDPNLRQTTGPISGSIGRRIPFYEQTLPPLIDQLGEPVAQPSPGILNQMVLPFRLSEDRLNDPVRGPLYESAGTVPRLKKRASETDRAFSERGVRTGGIMRGQLAPLVQDPRFGRLPTEAQQDVVTRTASRVRRDATLAEKAAFVKPRYQQYLREGMSDTDARERALADWAEEVGRSKAEPQPSRFRR